MSKVERAFYSLYGIGCKPHALNPKTIAFLYKQFCQSIFRYGLDNLLASCEQHVVLWNLLLSERCRHKRTSRFSYKAAKRGRSLNQHRGLPVRLEEDNEKNWRSKHLSEQGTLGFYRFYYKNDKLHWTEKSNGKLSKVWKLCW